MKTLILCLTLLAITTTANAKGICTYEPIVVVDLYDAVGNPVNFDAKPGTDVALVRSSDSVLYKDNEKVRTYSAQIPLNPPVTLMSGSDNPNYPAGDHIRALSNQYYEPLLALVLKKLQADCDKLETTGVCTCLGNIRN